jgi:hypothetical protein
MEDLSAFLWLFLALKIPVAAALVLVWWAVREPEPTAMPEEDDGGSRRPDPHRGPQLPKPPRRGPHSDQPLPAPPRVRTLARGRSLTTNE